MKVISNSDVRIFTDPDGDTLTLLGTVRHGDVDKCNELEAKEVLASLKDLGINMQEAWSKADSATPEDRKEAREKIAAGEKSAAVRRFRLGAIAHSAKIGGVEYGGNANVLKAYDQMPKASADWVDAQVDEIWAGATPGDDQREGPAALPGQLNLPDGAAH